MLKEAFPYRYKIYIAYSSYFVLFPFCVNMFVFGLWVTKNFTQYLLFYHKMFVIPPYQICSCVLAFFIKNLFSACVTNLENWRHVAMVIPVSAIV